MSESRWHPQDCIYWMGDKLGCFNRTGMQVLQCTKIEPNKNYHEIKSEKQNQIQLGPSPNPKLCPIGQKLTLNLL